MPAIDPTHRQTAHRLRFDWGTAGAAAVASTAGCTVVVDVLSFTTSVCVAVSRGAAVLPYRWCDDSAPAYAAARGAVLARGRRDALIEGGPSLSPASLRELSGVERLVLPSPNGSTIALELAGAGVTVVAASLRNVSAVADWLTPRADRGIAVVAAGERWPDGSLRPAVEDLWGAGAVIAGLVARGVTGLSPEAGAAAAVWDAVAGLGPGSATLLSHELSRCASGRELIDAGFGADVAIAAALDASPVVPVLTPGDDAFR